MRDIEKWFFSETLKFYFYQNYTLYFTCILGSVLIKFLSVFVNH